MIEKSLYTHEQSQIPVEDSFVPLRAQVPILSREEVYVLYATLQDLANELRRLTREQEKHQ